MRRRRRKGTWFPLLGSSLDEDQAKDSAYTWIEMVAPADGTPTLGVVPLTYDYPQESPALSRTTDTLSELVGSEYIIERIVGNIVAINRGVFDASEGIGMAAEGVCFTAALFVARAGAEDTPPLGEEAPIGYASTGVITQFDLQNYGPENPATLREPWMWRKTWILGNLPKLDFYRRNVTTQVNPGWSVCPPSTAEYGSIRDGGNIDVKSRRRVRLDERLFLALSARTLPINVAYDFGTYVSIMWQMRMYGNLVKAKPTGAF